MSLKNEIIAQLPLLAVMPLHEWQMVTITGSDAKKYLHSQVTINIETLLPSQHYIGAHCDAQGKMWAILRLFHYDNGFAYITRRSVIKKQLAELKKYAVFSKINIEVPANLHLVGIAGSHAKQVLQTLFKTVPTADFPLITCNHCTLFYFSQPADRYLIVINAEKSDALLQTLKTNSSAQLLQDKDWLALSLLAGIPIIDDKNSHQFLPQELSLSRLNGICYDKGCYLGQEAILKRSCRGINKRELYLLSGEASHLPTIGESLSWPVANGFKEGGTILAATQFAQHMLVQAILPNMLSDDHTFRLCQQSNSNFRRITN